MIVLVDRKLNYKEYNEIQIIRNINPASPKQDIGWRIFKGNLIATDVNWVRAVIFYKPFH